MTAQISSTTTVIRNATVLDTGSGNRRPDVSIVVEGDRIREVADGRPAVPSGAREIDARGRIAMPGLIDAHVHVLGLDTDLGLASQGSPLYLAARSSRLLAQMLSRGFTTVRDVGGADYGIARAVEEGLFPGPRIVYGGPALSQTGGHGDFRHEAGRGCGHAAPGSPAIGRVCDGSDEVRVACREEIARGARHIKIMVSGGVASPSDRIDSLQFGDDEIDAAVAEAERAGIYVTAHAYAARAINRALSRGVRCIEHGNRLDDETVRLLVEHDGYLVPTLAIGRLLASAEGARFGVTPESREKAKVVIQAGLESLEKAHRGGANVVFGTDFIGPMHVYQLHEFAVRGEVLPPLDILRSATITAAELLGERGEVGVIAEGARADVLILDADPLDRPGILPELDRHIATIIAAGRVTEVATAAV